MRSRQHRRTELHRAATTSLEGLRRRALPRVLSAWLMALQLVLHAVVMTLSTGGSGLPGFVICSVQGNAARGGAGGATPASQLPPCCVSGDCCCLTGAAPLPSVPTIPGRGGSLDAFIRPIVMALRAVPRAWRWQPRAPPSSGVFS